MHGNYLRIELPCDFEGEKGVVKEEKNRKLVKFFYSHYYYYN